jgi:hypothetical protein
MPRGTCWKGYVQKGFKKKGNRSVPNCVAVQNAYLGKAVRQPTETDNEFKIRHEMHSPFMDLKNKKKKIIKANTGKEVQGPQEKEKEGFAIEPQVRGATSFDQNIEKKTKGASLYLHTPGYGKVGIHYDKDTDKYPDNFKTDTTRKSVSYDIQKDIGSGTLTAGASIGKSDNALKSGKTKSGMISYTVPIGKSKGGLLKQGKPKLALRGWK